MPRVLIPLAQGCEELEAVTLIDILRRAGIEVIAAGLDEGPVRASRGVVLLPDTPLERVLDEHFDLIVLPGGMPGMTHLRADRRLLALLKKTAADGGRVAAICAAPAVLADAGLLDGRRATSYPGFLDGIAGVIPCEDSVVEDGGVITSRGPGTALDFALHLVAILVGVTRRNEVEAALMRPDVSA